MANRYAEKQYFECLFCNKKNRIKHSSYNQYCNHRCRWEHHYITVAIPKIVEGKLPPRDGKATVVRYITERDGYKCSQCNLVDWFGKQMILDIDHIDGDNENNNPSNWRFLCPNCHRMTPTWGNKKRI